MGSSVVTASGSPATASITIGPYSALILSQVPNVSPTLTITQTNGSATISWLNSYSGWVLDSSVTLAGNPPPWNQVSASQYQTNSTAIFINVNPSGGATFYRLRKP
jgi:5,10-methylenetetrahydrofolate reductase